ncbi:MAG: hypothetical protein E6I56_04845 [Chloroflexi bacterium]|nr:MAG: hypothetical protein E6I56_04845 [Chloroflexota bacterium]
MDLPSRAIRHAPPGPRHRSDPATNQLAADGVSRSNRQATGVGDLGLLDAHTILTLQATAGNAAVTSLLAGDGSLQRDATAVAPPTEGTEIDRMGVVDQDGTKSKDSSPGLNLRAGPGESSVTIARLENNEHVLVKRDMSGGWAYVIVTDGPYKTSTGYVAGAYLNTNMPPDPSAPDPGATLYRIAANERAHDFVRRQYGAATQVKGQDERFFTNVLQFVNDRAGRHFVVTKSKTKKVGSMDVDVDDKELVAGGQIWVPSLDFALSLKGTVSAGSWQRDAVEKLKNIGEKLLAIPVFIGGLLWGALESIKDLFVGLFDLVWGTIKSLGHNLVDAARAIWDLITDSKKRRAVLESIDTELREMLEKGSFLHKAFNWGRIIGYATMEVVSFVLLAGATAALKGGKFAARLSKLFKVIEEAPAIQKVVEGASKLSKTKAARVIIDKLGVAADVGKVAIESKPVRAVGKVIGTTAGGVAAIAAAPGRGVLKAAEWMSKGLRRLFGKSAKAERLAGKAAGAAEKATQTVYRGQAKGVPRVSHGQVIHDFGDGLYLTDSEEVGRLYAGTRGKEVGTAGEVLKAELDPKVFGRVLDLRKDERWAKYLAERPIPGSNDTIEDLIKFANEENYNSLFEDFLRDNKISLADFDTIIGPEFVRGGSQICVRNPKIAAAIERRLKLHR